jgi:general secretion pathway protein E
MEINMFFNKVTDTPQILNNSADELVRLAKLHNTKVIERIEEVPADEGWLTQSKHQEALINRYGECILLSNSGLVYTAAAQHNALDQAQRALVIELSIELQTVKIKVCSPEVMSQLYRQRNTLNVLQHKKNRRSITTFSQDESRSEAQKLVDALIENAAKAPATDIHIAVNQHTGLATIKFRVFGLMRPFHNHHMGSETWDAKSVTEAMSATINADAVKNNGSPKAFNPKEPLDALFCMQTKTGEKNIRYAQTPTGNGFKVVLRVLSMGAEMGQSNQSVEQLGYSPEQAIIIEEAALSSSGLLIIAGPTGSGKTTTLSILIEQLPAHLAIYTYEDPIEYTLSNATQVPVRADHAHLNWAALSKNALRLDPDVIMFGELRDPVVATEIVNAATTGHLVFTTLHTNSAIGCVTRLHDLGIPFSRLAEPGLLKLFVFQRLLPTNCSHCALLAEHVEASRPIQARQIERLVDYFKADLASLRFANTQPENACKRCQGTGIHGRVVVAEAVKIDATARAFIAAENIVGWEAHLKARGWQSIQAHAKNHVLTGQACPIVTESILSEKFYEPNHPMWHETGLATPISEIHS